MEDPSPAQQNNDNDAEERRREREEELERILLAQETQDLDLDDFATPGGNDVNENNNNNNNNINDNNNNDNNDFNDDFVMNNIMQQQQDQQDDGGGNGNDDDDIVHPVGRNFFNNNNNINIPATKRLSYVQISFGAALGLVFYALRTRQQWYLALVYLSSSKWAYIILGNSLIAFCTFLFHALTNFFLQGLRVSEAEGLGDFFRWNVTETCLALTMFRSELTVQTGILFLILILVKCLHWVVDCRQSHLRMTEDAILIANSNNWPKIPWNHVQLVLFMVLLQVVDIFAVIQCGNTIMNSGPSVSILFAFEYAIMLVSVICNLVLWQMHVLDGWLQYGHDVTEQGTWIHSWIHPWKEFKATILFAIEVQAQFVTFALYLIFFAIVLTYYGMPMNLVREVYMSFSALKQRLVAFSNYRQLMAQLNQMTRRPTEDQLNEAGRTCIICRDDMDIATCVVLPCGHIFHTSCLRDWLVQQQSCPTCRSDLRSNAALNAAQNRQQQQEQEQEQARDGQENNDHDHDGDDDDDDNDGDDSGDDEQEVDVFSNVSIDNNNKSNGQGHNGNNNNITRGSVAFGNSTKNNSIQSFGQALQNQQQQPPPGTEGSNLSSSLKETPKSPFKGVSFRDSASLRPEAAAAMSRSMAFAQKPKTNEDETTAATATSAAASSPAIFAPSWFTGAVDGNNSSNNKEKKSVRFTNTHHVAAGTANETVAFPAFYRVVKDEGANVWNNGSNKESVYLLRTIPFGVIVLGQELEWRTCGEYGDNSSLMIRIPQNGWIQDEDLQRIQAVPSIWLESIQQQEQQQQQEQKQYYD